MLLIMFKNILRTFEGEILKMKAVFIKWRTRVKQRQWDQVYSSDVHEAL